jgi:hypothetical protein
LVDPETRERGVLALLDSWPWESGGVVVGGYAALAYGPPRYSDDVDVVIPSTSATAIRSWLLGEGFELQRHSVPNPQNFAGEVERYVLGDIKLDLLAGAVRDWEAQVDVPEEWIS